MKPLTYLSFCTGIGGIDLGLQRAGMVCVGQVEIDPNCRHVLRRHFPGHQTGIDITNYEHTGPVPEVIEFGFPCQDLSVAGDRKGLGGSRSGIFWQCLRVVAQLKPRFLIIENVPGLFSSWSPCEPPPGQIPVDGWTVEESSDFETFLIGISQLGYCLGGGVLDTQYFGIPQRRDRIFIIGSLGDASCCEIFFEPESVRGDPAPSRTPKEGITCEIKNGVAGSLGGGAGKRGFCDDLDRSGAFIPEIADCLKAGGADGSPDGSGRGFNVIVDQRAYGGGNTAGEISTSTSTSQRYDFDTETFVVGTLTPGAHPGGYNGQDAYTGKILAVRTANTTANTTANGIGVSEDVSHTIDGANGQAVATQWGVRRLTPVECERLQGFPDGWTEWGIDEKGKRVQMSDGARYSMLGNAVTVAPAEWIGRRIMQFSK